MIPGIWVWVVWLPVVAIVAIMQAWHRAGVWRSIGVIALITYAFWIASAAFLLIPVDRVAGYFPRGINLVPLRDLVRSFEHLGAGQLVRQHGGNFLLLAPFTLLGPVLWPRLRAWKWAFAIGMGASMTIELGQLAISASVGYHYRTTDIDDVILNTAGALFGYAVFLGSRRAARAIRRRATEPRSGAGVPEAAEGVPGAGEGDPR